MAACDAESGEGYYGNEPYYNSPACRPEDIVCLGSDTEETSEETKQKNQRYEDQAKRFAAGILPVLQSASLRGPLSRTNWIWENPWRENRMGPERERDEIEDEDEDLLFVEEDEDLLDIVEDEDLLQARDNLISTFGREAAQDQNNQMENWWHPGTEMLFTRENVMKWAIARGLGHLSASEALKRCKATAAEEAIRKDSVQDQILVSVEGDDEVDTESSSYDPDIEMDNEYPVASLVSTKTHPQDEAMITDDHDDLSYLDQYAENTTAQNNKKRRSDSNWLRGSYVSKRARWDAGPVSSPTPLPNVISRHRQRELKQKNLLRHDHEQFLRLSAEKTNAPPITPNNHSEFQLRRAHHHKESISVEGSYLKSSKEDTLPSYEEDFEDMDELSGNSQDFVPIQLSSTAKSQQKRANNTANRSFSDLEEDDLVAISPQSRIKTPSGSRSSLRSRGLSSLKLPKLRSDPYVNDESFVTEVALSSRNVEKFKFRKKRRRRTDDEVGQNTAKPNGTVVAPISTEISGKGYSPEADNDLMGVPGLGKYSNITVPYERENRFVEEESITTISNHSKTGWDNLDNCVQSSFGITNDNSPSKTSAHSAQPIMEILPRISLLHSSPSNSHSRNSYPSKLKSRQTSPAKGILPSVPNLIASPPKVDKQGGTFQAAVSSVSKPMMNDFIGCVLPKFDWEDATQTGMDRIQLALSQNCPSNSQRDQQNVDIEASEQFPEIQQPKLHQFESNYEHTSAALSPRPELYVTGSQDREESPSENVTSLCDSPNLLLPQSSSPCRQYIRAHSARFTSPIPNSSVRQTSLPPKLNFRKSHSRSRTHKRYSTHVLPSIATTKDTEMPVSSLDQKNISTQSCNKYPPKSQQSTAVTREESPTTEGSPDKEDSSGREDSTTNEKDDVGARADPHQSHFTREQNDNMEGTLFVAEGDPTLDVDARTENKDMSDVDVSEDTSPNSSPHNDDRQATRQASPSADDSQQCISEVMATVTNINSKPNRNMSPDTPDESWEGCGPQSPWVAEPSQPLGFLSATIGILQSDTENELMAAAQDSPIKQTIGDSVLENVMTPQTPECNTFKSHQHIRTLKPSTQTSGGRIGDVQNWSEKSSDTITRNPWMSCLKNKSSTKSKKRVSFGILPYDQEKTSQPGKSSIRTRSPPPPNMPTHDEDFQEEETPMVHHNRDRFMTTKRFTQILPDHVHSQELVSSPALGAQAEAFIAADRGASSEQEHATITHNSPLRFLQPRIEASDNAIWGNRDEQSPIQVESPKSPTTAPMPDFNMEEALGEIGDFLGGDWSVDAEIKKAKELVRSSPDRLEDTGYRRRRLFGLI